MSLIPQPWTVTETQFHWRMDDMPYPVRLAICEWALFHGLDPKRIPQVSPIVRDVDRCQVRCRYIVLSDDGVRSFDKDTLEYATVDHVAQGEAPPLPWPDLVQKYIGQDS